MAQTTDDAESAAAIEHLCGVSLYQANRREYLEITIHDLGQ